MDIKLPTSYGQLTAKELKFVFGLMAMPITEMNLLTRCLVKFSRIRKIKKREGGFSFVLDGERGEMTLGKLQFCLKILQFLKTPPDSPVRIPQYKDMLSLKEDFADVPFSVFLRCENLFQAYLQTGEKRVLVELANTMMPARRKKRDDLPGYVLVSVFFWFASLKKHFASMYRSLFTVESGNGKGLDLVEKPLAVRLAETMNSQIHALTKRDVSKEESVLSCSTPRCLAQLDALARETIEIKKISKK